VSGVEKLIFGDGSVKLLGSVAHGSGNDLIGNGFGDVLWRSDSGAVALWALNGATITGGGFVNGGTALTPDWNIAGISDFNGDGRGDILWRNDDGRVAEWNMNGLTVAGGGFVNGGAAVTLAWQIAGVGDFNGDHKADILWHGSDGVVGLWQMDGPNITGGGFVNGGTLVSMDWSVAGVADFSGDGKADILWRNVDGRIAEWTMNGLMVAGGGFVNGGASVTPDWTIAGVGDFSGDHKADILWQNTDGRVGLWQMDGANLVLGGFANGGTPVIPDWHIAGVGDFSGDGRSDILWRNDDGRIAEWNMNGTTLWAAASSTTVSRCSRLDRELTSVTLTTRISRLKLKKNKMVDGSSLNVLYQCTSDISHKKRWSLSFVSALAFSPTMISCVSLQFYHPSLAIFRRLAPSLRDESLN
jgi:hypothetical protein